MVKYINAFFLKTIAIFMKNELRLVKSIRVFFWFLRAEVLLKACSFIRESSHKIITKVESIESCTVIYNLTDIYNKNCSKYVHLDVL